MDLPLSAGVRESNDRWMRAFLRTFVRPRVRERERERERERAKERRRREEAAAASATGDAVMIDARRCFTERERAKSAADSFFIGWRTRSPVPDSVRRWLQVGCSDYRCCCFMPRGWRCCCVQSLKLLDDVPLIRVSFNIDGRATLDKILLQIWLLKSWHFERFAIWYNFLSDLCYHVLINKTSIFLGVWN